jgi:hypothetical protein
MCPGAQNNGCPSRSKAAVSNGRQRIYCIFCQAKVAANIDNVLESQRKATERAQGITVAVPHITSLKRLGQENISKCLKNSIVQKIKGKFIGIDTSSTAQGSCDWEDLNGVGGFYIEQGVTHTFVAKRTYSTAQKSIHGKWSVLIDDLAPINETLVPMLKRFARWCSGRTIAYHTAQADCDFKRLTSVFTEKTTGIISAGSPFPPRSDWLNTGQDIYRHLIGPKNVPIISTHWKLSIIHEDLYELKRDSTVSVSLDSNIVKVDEEGLTNVLSDAMKTWNILMVIHNIYLY